MLNRQEDIAQQTHLIVGASAKAGIKTGPLPPRSEAARKASSTHVIWIKAHLSRSAHPHLVSARGKVMALEDEAVGLHRRLSSLQEALKHITDPLGATLVKMVIEDIEARLVELASVSGSSLSEPPQPAVQEQQLQRKRDEGGD